MSKTITLCRSITKEILERRSWLKKKKYIAINLRLNLIKLDNIMYTYKAWESYYNRIKRYRIREIKCRYTKHAPFFLNFHDVTSHTREPIQYTLKYTIKQIKIILLNNIRCKTRYILYNRCRLSWRTITVFLQQS